MTWNRIAALLIDSLILIVLAVPLMDFGTETRMQDGREIETLKFGLDGLPLALWAIGDFAYFVCMEWLFGGTVGKLLIGIRVTDKQGFPCSFGKALARNLLRPVDAFPYLIPYLVGFLVMGGTQGRQRLGDRVAGTMVVPRAEAVLLPDAN